MGHMHYYYLVTRTTLLLKLTWKEEDDCVRISVSKNQFTLADFSGTLDRVYNHIWSRF